MPDEFDPNQQAQTPEAEAPEAEAPEAEAQTTAPEAADEAALPSGEGRMEQKPAAAPATEPSGAKKPDHVNDPIDPALKKATRERIQALVSRTKEMDGELGEVRKVITAIQDTGATPEQFGYMLGYMKLVHSEKPEDLEAAARALQNELRAIALRLGKPVDGYDPVAKHDDLAKAVQAGQITQELAQQIAQWRESQVDKTLTAKQQQEQQSRAQAAETERAAAVKDLNDLEKQLAATDSEYQRKYDVLVPMLKPVMASLPPSQWKARFLEEYVKLRLAPANGTAAASAAASAQPLRARSPAGGQVSEPKNAHDAIFGSPAFAALVPGARRQ